MGQSGAILLGKRDALLCEDRDEVADEEVGILKHDDLQS